jgi:hypothetical protein
VTAVCAGAQVTAVLAAQLRAHAAGARLFEPTALDMLAKAVSGASGDLRQALRVRRRSREEGRWVLGGGRHGGEEGVWPPLPRHPD